eukprot:Rmarinus@m.9821
MTQDDISSSPEEKLQFLEAEICRASGANDLKKVVDLRVQTKAYTLLCYGNRHPAVVSSLVKLAESYLAVDLPSYALLHLEKARDLNISLQEEYEGCEANHPGVLCLLAKAYYANGSLDRAVSCSKRAVDFAEAVFGPHSPQTWPPLAVLSAAALEARALDVAWDATLRLLEVEGDVGVGLDAFSTGLRAAYLERDQGDYDGFFRWLQKSYALANREYGPSKKRAGVSLHLGVACAEAGDDRLAKRYLNEFLGTFGDALYCRVIVTTVRNWLESSSPKALEVLGMAARLTVAKNSTPVVLTVKLSNGNSAEIPADSPAHDNSAISTEDNIRAAKDDAVAAPTGPAAGTVKSSTVKTGNVKSSSEMDDLLRGIANKGRHGKTKVSSKPGRSTTRSGNGKPLKPKTKLRARKTARQPTTAEAAALSQLLDDVGRDVAARAASSPSQSSPSGSPAVRHAWGDVSLTHSPSSARTLLPSPSRSPPGYPRSPTHRHGPGTSQSLRDSDHMSTTTSNVDEDHMLATSDIDADDITSIPEAGQHDSPPPATMDDLRTLCKERTCVDGDSASDSADSFELDWRPALQKAAENAKEAKRRKERALTAIRPQTQIVVVGANSEESHSPGRNIPQSPSATSHSPHHALRSPKSSSHRGNARSSDEWQKRAEEREALRRRKEKEDEAEENRLIQLYQDREAAVADDRWEEVKEAKKRMADDLRDIQSHVAWHEAHKDDALPEPWWVREKREKDERARKIKEAQDRMEREAREKADREAREAFEREEERKRKLEVAIKEREEAKKAAEKMFLEEQKRREKEEFERRALEEKKKQEKRERERAEIERRLNQRKEKAKVQEKEVLGRQQSVESAQSAVVEGKRSEEKTKDDAAVLAAEENAKREKEKQALLEREERERERERLEREENDRRKREKEEKEKRDRVEKERLARERKQKEKREREEKERLARQKADEEKKEREERERLAREKEEKEKEERAEKVRLQKEKEEKEKAHRDRMRAEIEERERREREEAASREAERIEKEKREREEKEEQLRKEKEKKEREKKEREEKEKIEREKKEREDRELLDKERRDRERRELEEKEKSRIEREEKEKREREEKERLARLAREREEREARERDELERMRLQEEEEKRERIRKQEEKDKEKPRPESDAETSVDETSSQGENGLGRMRNEPAVFERAGEGESEETKKKKESDETEGRKETEKGNRERSERYQQEAQKPPPSIISRRISEQPGAVTITPNVLRNLIDKRTELIRRIQLAVQQGASSKTGKGGLRKESGTPDGLRELEFYDLHDEVGKGAFGKVQAATHILTGVQVAIKVFDKDVVRKYERARNQGKLTALDHYSPLLKEVEVLKRLSHPNIVSLFQMIETAKRFYVVLELAGGGSLDAYLKKVANPLGENESKGIFGQLVSAVEHMHSRRFCHRDIKPDNCLLAFPHDHGTKGVSGKGYPFVKLIDFGLGENLGKKLDLMCGTPAYVPPEIINHQKYFGSKVDVWSLGVLLYILLTGRYPFDGKDKDEMYENICAAKYKPLEDHFSPDVKDLVSQIFQVNPKDRVSLSNVRKHPWLADFPFSSPQSSDDLPKPLPLDDDVFDEVVSAGYPRDLVRSLIRAPAPNFTHSAVVMYRVLLTHKQQMAQYE